MTVSQYDFTPNYLGVLLQTTDPEVIKAISEHEPLWMGGDLYHMVVPIGLLSPQGSWPAAESWNWND